MVKSKTLSLGCGILTIAGTLLFSQNVYAEADGFKTFETEQYYENNVNELTTDDWYDDFASTLQGMDEAKKTALKGLHYYLKLNPSVDLNGIKTHDDPSNPDNVNRVIRLMPEEDYEKMFPNSKEGPCSYINFLKSVALLPGLFSDYKDFKGKTGLEPTEDMGSPDLIAKKILAAIMANAVQETSNTGKGDFPTMEEKVPGTFSTVKEDEAAKYNVDMKIFDPKSGAWGFVAEGNIYSGRGVHQVTYVMNYANISLILYGDLRLVKYPDLLASDTILPWLTTLVYFIMPQSQYPTIAEVFDGQWERYLDTLNVGPNKEKYKIEFPVCVLLINGGIECGDAAIVKENMTEKQKKAIRQANNNTAIRGSAYHHFVGGIPIKGKVLFSDDSPEYKKSLTGEEVFKACLSISQTDSVPASKGIYTIPLSWHRPFFLQDDLKPATWYTDYMVFAGINIERLMKNP
jgi:hypothetical protein